jgi:hypothetical protein
MKLSLASVLDQASDFSGQELIRVPLSKMIYGGSNAYEERRGGRAKRQPSEQAEQASEATTLGRAWQCQAASALASRGFRLHLVIMLA